MTRGLVLRLTVAALVLAVVLSETSSGQRRLSVDLWLTVIGVWAAWRIGRALLETLPMQPGRLRSPFRIGGGAGGDEPLIPRDLRSLEGGVLAAVHHPRAFSHRVRPRLLAVAEHRLRIHHGIDLHREPDRADDALGDLAWLIDPTVVDRSPTEAELMTFLDRLDPEGVPR